VSGPDGSGGEPTGSGDHQVPDSSPWGDHLGSTREGRKLEGDLDSHKQRARDLGAYEPRIPKDNVAHVSRPEVDRIWRLNWLAARVWTGGEVTSKADEHGRATAEAFMRAGRVQNLFLFRRGRTATLDQGREVSSNTLTTVHIGRLGYWRATRDGAKIRASKEDIKNALGDAHLWRGFFWERDSAISDFSTKEERETKPLLTQARERRASLKEEISGKDEAHKKTKEEIATARERVNGAKKRLAAARKSGKDTKSFEEAVTAAKDTLTTLQQRGRTERRAVLDAEKELMNAGVAVLRARWVVGGVMKKGDRARRSARRADIIRTLRGDPD
jgi:hypothetical protein